MKAVIFHEHGDVNVLQYTDHPAPDLGAGQVLVRIHAAALNRMDLWVREGWPGIRLRYPHIPGADGAGTLTALGPGVTGWQLGDRVVINSNLSCGNCEYCNTGFDNRCRTWHLLGETIPGTYAEYVAISAQNIKTVPDGFDLHQAAAAALVYHTAWHSLITRGNLRPGETVLIIGASGGVNAASIQIAKLAGAVVYVVGFGPDKLALAESLGADFLIDRSQEENWSKTVYQLTNRIGVDVVVDNVGTTFPLSFRAARKGGRILTVGNTGGPRFEIDNRFVFSKHLSIVGSTMGTRPDFETVMDLVFAGKLMVPVGSTFPLAEARAAQKLLEKGEQLGKITLSVHA